MKTTDRCLELNILLQGKTQRAMRYAGHGPHLYHFRVVIPWTGYLSSLNLFPHLFFKTGDNNGALPTRVAVKIK